VALELELDQIRAKRETESTTHATKVSELQDELDQTKGTMQAQSNRITELEQENGNMRVLEGKSNRQIEQMYREVTKELEEAKAQLIHMETLRRENVVLKYKEQYLKKKLGKGDDSSVGSTGLARKLERGTASVSSRSLRSGISISSRSVRSTSSLQSSNSLKSSRSRIQSPSPSTTTIPRVSSASTIASKSSVSSRNARSSKIPSPNTASPPTRAPLSERTRGAKTSATTKETERGGKVNKISTSPKVEVRQTRASIARAAVANNVQKTKVIDRPFTIGEHKLSSSASLSQAHAEKNKKNNDSMKEEKENEKNVRATTKSANSDSPRKEIQSEEEVGFDEDGLVSC